MSSAKQQVGIGIIGAGNIAHTHAKAIMGIENAKLLGIYNINKNKSDEFAATHKCKSFSSFNDMLEDPSIILYCICTPSGLHADYAVKVLQAGKHCLIEKPLDITLLKCDEIIETAIRYNGKVGTVFPSRFTPSSMLLKSTLDEGRFGKIVLANAYVKWFRSEEYYNSAAWRGTWSLDGGGALMNQGIHSVDLLQWLAGDIEYVKSISANVRHHKIEVEDAVVSVLKFRNGALGTIECTTAVYPGEPKRIEISGTTGMAVMEENKITKWEFPDKRSTDVDIIKSLSDSNSGIASFSVPTAISYTGHQIQIENMIDAIINNTPILVDAVEGRKSVAITLAIYESAKSGQTITL